MGRLGARPGPSTRSRHCNSRPTGSTEYFGALNRARHQFLVDEVLGLRTGLGPVSRRSTTRSSRKVTRSKRWLHGRGRGMSRIDARAAPPMDNAAAARSAGWALQGCERPSTKVAISRHQRLATLDPSSIQKNSSIRRQPEAGGPDDALVRRKLALSSPIRQKENPPVLGGGREVVWRPRRRLGRRRQRHQSFRGELLDELE